MKVLINIVWRCGSPKNFFFVFSQFHVAKPCEMSPKYGIRHRVSLKKLTQ